MNIFILTLSDKQTEEAMRTAGVKSKEALAHILKGTRLLVCHFEDWQYFVVDNSDVPNENITWRETWKYVEGYLGFPSAWFNKSLLSRLASVLMRLMTFSIKPKQWHPSGKDGSKVERDA